MLRLPWRGAALEVALRKMLLVLVLVLVLVLGLGVELGLVLRVELVSVRMLPLVLVRMLLFVVLVLVVGPVPGFVFEDEPVLETVDVAVGDVEQDFDLH